LRIALPHLVSVLSENQVSPAERVYFITLEAALLSFFTST